MLEKMMQLFNEIGRTMRPGVEWTQNHVKAFGNHIKAFGFWLFRVFTIPVAFGIAVSAAIVIVWVGLPYLLEEINKLGTFFLGKPITLNKIAKGFGVGAFGVAVVLATMKDLVKSLPEFGAFYRDPSLRSLCKPVNLVFFSTAGLCLSLSLPLSALTDSAKKDIPPALQKELTHIHDSLSTIQAQFPPVRDTLDRMETQLAPVQIALNNLVESQFPPIHNKLDTLLTIANKCSQPPEHVTFKDKDDEHIWIIQATGELLYSLRNLDKLGALPANNGQTLAEIVEVLKTFPDSDIRVEGHTDHLPIKEEHHTQWPSNLELSEARAKAVASYLKEQGIAPHRISIVGHADYRPVVTSHIDTDKEIPQNRRVEIILLPSTASRASAGALQPDESPHT